MSDAQTRYFKAEELALASTLKELPAMLEGTDPKKAFLRTFDVAFGLGFSCAVVMYFAQHFDIRKVDTSQTQLDVS